MQNKFNILHVEDSEKARLLYRLNFLQLKNAGGIDEAGTVSEAKELLSNKKIDVAVLDIILPDGSGIFLLEWIKKNFPAICVIMLSNYSDDTHRYFSKKAGADYFFDKANEFAELQKVICQLNNY